MLQSLSLEKIRLTNVIFYSTCTYNSHTVLYTDEHTAGAVSITNAVSITTAPFAAVFSALTNYFSIFTF
jgi:hypothetical protein